MGEDSLPNLIENIDWDGETIQIKSDAWRVFVRDHIVVVIVLMIVSLFVLYAVGAADNTNGITPLTIPQGLRRGADSTNDMIGKDSWGALGVIATIVIALTIAVGETQKRGKEISSRERSYQNIKHLSGISIFVEVEAIVISLFSIVSFLLAATLFFKEIRDWIGTCIAILIGFWTIIDASRAQFLDNYNNLFFDSDLQFRKSEIINRIRARTLSMYQSGGVANYYLAYLVVWLVVVILAVLPYAILATRNGISFPWIIIILSSIFAWVIFFYFGKFSFFDVRISRTISKIFGVILGSILSILNLTLAVIFSGSASESIVVYLVFIGQFAILVYAAWKIVCEYAGKTSSSEYDRNCVMNALQPDTCWFSLGAWRHRQEKFLEKITQKTAGFNSSHFADSRYEYASSPDFLLEMDLAKRKAKRDIMQSAEAYYASIDAYEFSVQNGLSESAINPMLNAARSNAQKLAEAKEAARKFFSRHEIMALVNADSDE